MKAVPILVLIADDDVDNNTFFKNALNEIPFVTELIEVLDGEQLMKHLYIHLHQLPDIIFLDLSMPRKTGIECLAEINEHPLLKEILVILLSTAFPSNQLYEDSLKKTLLGMGAKDFIRKPNDFEHLKKIIHNSLLLIPSKKPPLP